jgi:hypothetical protein
MGQQAKPRPMAGTSFAQRASLSLRGSCDTHGPLFLSFVDVDCSAPPEVTFVFELLSFVLLKQKLEIPTYIVRIDLVLEVSNYGLLRIPLHTLLDQ